MSTTKLPPERYSTNGPLMGAPATPAQSRFNRDGRQELQSTVAPAPHKSLSYNEQTESPNLTPLQRELVEQSVTLFERMFNLRVKLINEHQQNENRNKNLDQYIPQMLIKPERKLVKELDDQRIAKKRQELEQKIAVLSGPEQQALAQFLKDTKSEMVQLEDRIGSDLKKNTSYIPALNSKISQLSQKTTPANPTKIKSAPPPSPLSPSQTAADRSSSPSVVQPTSGNVPPIKTSGNSDPSSGQGGSASSTVATIRSKESGSASPGQQSTSQTGISNLSERQLKSLQIQLSRAGLWDNNWGIPQLPVSYPFNQGFYSAVAQLRANLSLTNPQNWRENPDILLDKDLLEQLSSQRNDGVTKGTTASNNTNKEKSPRRETSVARAQAQSKPTQNVSTTSNPSTNYLNTSSTLASVPQEKREAFQKAAEGTGRLDGKINSNVWKNFWKVAEAMSSISNPKDRIPDNLHPMILAIMLTESGIGTSGNYSQAEPPIWRDLMKGVNYDMRNDPQTAAIFIHRYYNYFRAQVGSSRFDSWSQEQKLANFSVAYNRGHNITLEILKDPQVKDQPITSNSPAVGLTYGRILSRNGRERSAEIAKEHARNLLDFISAFNKGAAAAASK